MRLHALSITAFGPFADTVEVDFDSLSDAGLFLLSGPTGAGKSSVLDAVCFALYGDVPGDRSTAGRLRCDQAADGVAPRVRLEVTLSGRRFRIERSPKWERRKLRGTGLTTAQASVVLSERVHDEWQPLSTRLDETGHLVTGLVGLTLTQFCQVAMLPQGRFQAFLRARSEDRHALLRQVFRTGRFDRIEQWLRDRRLDLQRSSADRGRTVSHLVGRLSETASRPIPETWDVADLSMEAGDATVASWSSDLLTDAGAAIRLAADTRAHADGAARTLTDELQLGRTVAARQLAHAAAAERLAAHDSAALQDQRERLRRAERAEPLSDLADSVAAEGALLTRRRAAASRSLDAWLHLAPASAPDPSPPAPADLPGLLTAARRSLDLAEAVLPDADRLVELGRSVAGHESSLADATAEVDRLVAELATVPVRLRDAEAALATTEVSARGLPATLAALDAARDRADATSELGAAAGDLASARLDHDAARSVLARLKEVWLDVREARLEGMAAEIAGQLVVGGCCPVCGSHEHPHLAVAARGSTDAAAERSARKDVDDAEAVLLVLDDQLRQSEARHTRLVTLTAGLSEVEATQALFAAEQAHEAATTATTAVQGLRAEVATLRAAGAALSSERDVAMAHRSEVDSQLRLHRAETSRLESNVAGALADSGCRTLPELIDVRTRRLDALSHTSADHEALAETERDLARAERALLVASTAAGFTSVDAAQAARLAPSQRDALASAISTAEDAHRADRVVVEDPDHVRAAAQPPVDVAVLAAACDAAEATARAAHVDHDAAVRRHERLAVLVDELAMALSRWEPVRAELEVTARLAHFAEGKSADNTLQMRLSAYVLAHRLSQVVAAANERLARMSDQRYSLEHTGKRGAGETRGGLSLLVRDDWSGEARDPATLSGGETFVVSLALALGLADVITQEAGGADLDTLFVDEGFGSLDADTLDDVMDTLDGLRDGGRVVGVVSHVAEMQTRIPAQLRVTKGRDGSRVSVSAAAS